MYRCMYMCVLIFTMLYMPYMQTACFLCISAHMHLLNFQLFRDLLVYELLILQQKCIRRISVFETHLHSGHIRKASTTQVDI